MLIQKKNLDSIKESEVDTSSLKP